MTGLYHSWIDLHDLVDQVFSLHAISPAVPAPKAAGSLFELAAFINKACAQLVMED